MTNDEKMALLLEIVEATHRQPPPVSFTVEEYVDMVEQSGGHIESNGARKKLMGMVDRGELEGDKFSTDGSLRWHFWKPANNPQ